jgi:hypothetical protein
MITAVAFDYLAGIAAGLVVLVVGWRRFVRGPRTTAGRDQRGVDLRRLALTGVNRIAHLG